VRRRWRRRPEGPAPMVRMETCVGSGLGGGEGGRLLVDADADADGHGGVEMRDGDRLGNGG
jgi:hypothetical protein